MKIYVVIENWCDGVTNSSCEIVSHHLTCAGATKKVEEFKSMTGDVYLGYFIEGREVED